MNPSESHDPQTESLARSKDFWKRKLLAYLHDPPEKALDIPGHTERRKTYVRNAFGEARDFSWFFDHICDHTAAAADRFCFPKYPHGKADFDPAEGAPFRHPLGTTSETSGQLIFENGCPTAKTLCRQTRGLASSSSRAYKETVPPEPKAERHL